MRTPDGKAPDVPDDLSLALSEDMLAAEYVVGTLDADERADAQARIASDFSFAALVAAWERRLGELHTLTGDAEPPPAVWDAIKAKLPQTAPSSAMQLPEVAPRDDVRVLAGPDLLLLHGRLVRWRTAAAFTGSLAAVLLAWLVASTIAPERLPAPLRPKPAAAPAARAGSSGFVVVLQRDAVSPAFILIVDPARQSLMLHRVGAPKEPGKTYELWLISSRLPGPRSLGLVGSGDVTRVSDPLVADIGDATFAVSLEPDGGSLTGAPSNVVFLGKPVETALPPPDSEAPQ
jgi:anti-sigma-K factor RskA